MWRTWKVGQLVRYIVNDFDGRGEYDGVVKAVFTDHAIVEADGMTLWVEDFNQDMFI